MREYLSGLDGVTSAEVDVNVEFMGEDRWTADVTLKDDPGLDSVLAIVRDARNKVISITDSDDVDLDVTWNQGATTVACHLPINDAEKAPSSAAVTLPSRGRPSWPQRSSRRPRPDGSVAGSSGANECCGQSAPSWRRSQERSVIQAPIAATIRGAISSSALTSSRRVAQTTGIDHGA